MTVSLSSATPLLGIPAEPKPAKAEDAAQQFESLLINQMMRSAWESAERLKFSAGVSDPPSMR